VETRDLQAKTVLIPCKRPDTWFGTHYTLNLYRGCQHQCVYCDTRSECYGIEAFDSEVLVKANALELLACELPRKRRRGVVGLGSMNDPYMPLEATRRLTRGALELLARHRFPLHLITKGTLVTRDVDLLQQIGQVFAAVSISITTPDDALAGKLEPGAPPSSARFAALSALRRAGILAGVTLMPVLPFLEDDPAAIRALVDRAAEAGASWIIPAFGVTLRDRQRATLYRHLDALFPGLSACYRASFGDAYFAPARGIRTLEAVFREACQAHGIPSRFPGWQPTGPEQLSLF
jgi:DNA repair photolyase